MRVEYGGYVRLEDGGQKPSMVEEEEEEEEERGEEGDRMGRGSDAAAR